jgi:hypothetical protein
MFGARPIRRWVQENVVTMIAEMLVRGEAGAGSTISVEAMDDNKGLKYEVVKGVADPAARLTGDSGDNSKPESMRPPETGLNLFLPIKAFLARFKI